MTIKATLQRTVCIPHDTTRVGCHAADMAIHECIEQDDEGRRWWQGPLYENHRVVGLHRESDRWVVTVESSKRV